MFFFFIIDFLDMPCTREFQMLGPYPYLTRPSVTDISFYITSNKTPWQVRVEPLVEPRIPGCLEISFVSDFKLAVSYVPKEKKGKTDN